MLVVQGRKATDQLPPFYGAQGIVAPDQEDVEGNREGARVETSKGPLSQVAVEGEVHRGCFRFVEGHR